MIEKCWYLRSESINPYYNLAIENYLYDHIPANSMIFFLCQNQKSVLIGNKQNAYKECHLQAMEDNHVYLARRSSGGGTVYQDLGNLNFSFIMYIDNFDIHRQTEAIVNALKSLGLNVTASGNDIEIEGKKISGSAYLTEKEHCLHHGTIMWNVNINHMDKYLNVSDKKIQAKGVDSVASRVGNIIDYRKDISLDRVQRALLQAVANEYGPLHQLNMPTEIDDYLEHYHSYNFIYNTINEYTIIIHDYYSFGELQMYVDLKKSVINKVDIYTDALDVVNVEKMEKLFTGLHVDDASFRQRLLMIFGREYLNDMTKIYFSIKRYVYE